VGNGTTATITTDAVTANYWGAIGRTNAACSVTGCSNALFNLTGPAVVFTQTSETTLTYPCTATGTAAGAPRLNVAHPFGELVIRMGDMRLAADVTF
jgi:hypothetical protein